MKFYQRLDFLMSLTKISNATLARSVALDPSYICRLRNGERSPYPNADYLRTMSVFFSKKITEAYQLAALEEILKSNNIWGDHCGSHEQTIYHWLSDDLGKTSLPIASLIHDFN